MAEPDNAEVINSLKKVLNTHKSAVLEGDPYSEKNAGKNTEFLEACLDTLYIASDGEIWDKSQNIAMQFGLDESIPSGLKGVYAEFIPMVQPSDKRGGKAIFAMSNPDDRPKVISQMLYLEAILNKEGHILLDSHYVLTDESKTTYEDLFTGLSLLIIGSTKKRKNLLD